jgi:hypothetical protein
VRSVALLCAVLFSSVTVPQVLLCPKCCSALSCCAASFSEAHITLGDYKKERKKKFAGNQHVCCDDGHYPNVDVLVEMLQMQMR